MKYKVKTLRGKRALVTVEFEEERFALAGELMLAERPFLRQIIRELENTRANGNHGSFAGNAFSLSIAPDRTASENEVNGASVTVPTDDLLKLAKAYQKQYESLKR